MALKTTSGWSGDGHGTDSFGFAALPGGYRFGYSNPGGFVYAGDNADWWTSSPIGGGGNFYYRSVRHDTQDIERASANERFGFSVRCLRDDQ